MANYSDIKYQAAGSATAIYADMAALIAATGMSAGDQALVTALNKVFMYTGTAWYTVATMTNASPTAITGVDGSYGLANDGTATTITAVSTDPEGFPLTWSYAVTTGSLGSTATVSQADNVFTITPSSTPADAGSFSITFSVTDGATGAVNAVSAFTLQFSVTNSRYTSLLLKATTTGLQTFDDASTSNHTITAGGNVTASTFSPHRHGGYSLRFENPATDDNNIKFDNTTGSGAVAASGEFCVETWVKFTVIAPPAGTFNPRIFASNGSGGNAADNLSFIIEYGGWVFDGAVSIYSNAFIYRATSSAEKINDGLWHHLAMTRDSSNNLRYFVDGSLIATIANNTTTFQFEETRLGKRDSGTGQSCYTGDMRDTRVVIGSSVYESAFTPPTEPLTAIANTYLLVGDLPYIKDESTNNFSINAGTYNNGSNVLLPKKVPLSLFDNAAYSEASHGASVYFDGSGDYITAADHEDFNMGSENFTAECWIYPTASPSQPIIMGQWSGSYSWALEMSNNSSRHLRFLTNAGSIVDNVSSTAVPLNQWSHVALVRNGTSFVAYLNGTSVVSSTVTGALANSTNALSIGASASGSYPFQGYISNVRLVKGTAAYTSNFTPPAAPLTAITNTKFLLNPEPAIIDLAQKFHLTGGTGPEGSTTQVAIAGTKSIMHTDFSTAYGVYIQGYSPEFRLNSTFTLEFWAYLAMWNQDTHFYETYGGTNNSFDNATGTETRIGIIGSQLTHRNNFGSNAIGNYFKQNTDYSNIVYHAANYGITFDNAQWHHWAITQDDSGNCKWYLDGTQIWSYTISLPIAITNTSNYRMRSTAWGNNSSPGPAYIQDYRLTRGLIRYTSNFTPPTAELEG